MAEITISDLPSKTALLDSDMVPIDDGTQSYRVTGVQLREFLKVNFLPVGTIVWSQSNLAADNAGRLPLWTGEYIASASTLYPDFYAWVKKHTELCKTKEQYDAALAQFGECPFYVVDEEEGSLRLPKLQHYIKNATAEEGITQREEGLPDHTHTTLYSSMRTGDTNGVDCWRGNTEVQTGPASESNPIYGRSEHVTPAHTTLYPWVYAYNAAIAASVAQAAEFQEGLSGKADTDLANTNPSASFKEMAMRWGSPDYSTFTTIAASTNFEAPSAGVISFVPKTNTDTAASINVGGNGYLSIAGKTLLQTTYTHGSDSGHPDSGFFPIDKGEIVYHTMNYGTVYFYSAKGVSMIDNGTNSGGQESSGNDTDLGDGDYDDF